MLVGNNYRIVIGLDTLAEQQLIRGTDSNYVSTSNLTCHGLANKDQLARSVRSDSSPSRCDLSLEWRIGLHWML